MTTVGEVNKIEELVIEWKIGNYFSLSKKVNKSYNSPVFDFDGESWYMSIYPNGEKENSAGYIGLYLYRKFSGPAISLEYYLGLKTFDEEIYKEIYFNYVFENAQGCGTPQFMNRSTLFERRSELVPSTVLSVVCRITYAKQITTKRLDNSVTAKCEYCKMSLEVHEDLSSHQEKCLNIPLKCPKCGDVIALKNWYDHKCQIAEAGDQEKLIRDLKEMLLSGDHSDTIIMVKGEEFRLHKTILAVRNSYFHAMFKNDMKEKITGIVSIDDCEPDIFRSFTYFLYTGNVDKLSSKNVCGLYEAANKYQEEQLKENCLHFILNTVSVDNICDFIVLALRHDDKKLLQNTTEFFANKTKEIIRSVKWQNFLIEYPIQANELLIKALN